MPQYMRNAVLPTDRKIGVASAMGVIMGNMVGTGIFTTTGLMLADFNNPWSILMVWLVGGLVAICGALTYAEISVAIPENGGEYLYLSRLFHPFLGFLSGWISFIVGFSASIAAVAVVFAEYMQSVFPDFPLIPGAILAVIIFSMIHLWNVRLGVKLHDFFTGILVLLILALIAGGIYAAFVLDTNKALLLQAPEVRTLISPSFATALILVMYAYSGWNAAAYLGGEVKEPARALPTALIGGALLVTALYAGLNVFYLMAVSTDQLAGRVEIAHIATKGVFGADWGKWVSILVSLACLSSLSAMTMTGPRVYYKMGEDFTFFRLLAKRIKGGPPFIAILLQALLAILLILTFAFETILTYIGFTLSLFAGLTVASVFILRKKQRSHHQSYKTLGYPVTPLFFIVVMTWMVVHALVSKPLAAFTGLGTIAVGALIYWGISKQ